MNREAAHQLARAMAPRVRPIQVVATTSSSTAVLPSVVSNITRAPEIMQFKTFHKKPCQQFKEEGGMLLRVRIRSNNGH
jgi:hypothetical protein